MVTKSKIGKCQPNVTVLQKKSENKTASNSKINNYIHTNIYTHSQTLTEGGEGREERGREERGRERGKDSQSLCT